MAVKKIRHHPLWYAFACSLLMHLSVFNSLLLYFQVTGQHFRPLLNPKLQMQEVIMAPAHPIRIIGKKDGKQVLPARLGDHLSAKLSPTSPPRPLEIADLAPLAPKIKKNLPPSAEKTLPVHTFTDTFSLQEIHKEMQKELTIAPRFGDIFSNHNINFSFEVPEGVSEDELNSAEKIFYSFQRRTFRSYLHSFASAYMQMAQNRPYLLQQEAYLKAREKMTGKVTFDLHGNIIAIKFIQGAENKDLQELFENTLKGIKSLPNPPKALLQENQEFAIYYQLNINHY